MAKPRPLINWQVLAQAITHYQSKGWKQIEVPWLVPVSVIEATAPRKQTYHQVRTLRDGVGVDIPRGIVASGEQGFIELMRQGELIAHEHYMALTPCARVESFEPQGKSRLTLAQQKEVFDFLHHETFMKLELCIPIKMGPSPLSEEEEELCALYLKTIEEEATSFFQSLGLDTFAYPTSATSFDIEEPISGIELGSYGVRTWENFTWLYGTGCAEPRTSQVMRLEPYIQETKSKIEKVGYELISKMESE